MADYEVGYKKPPHPPFEKGNTYSKGRTEGARNRLNKAFLMAMAEAFEINGVQAIKTVVAENPKDFLKIVADLQPKEHADVTNKLDDLTDEQLEIVAARVRGIIPDSESGGEGNSQAQEVQPSKGIPSLQ